MTDFTSFAGYRVATGERPVDTGMTEANISRPSGQTGTPGPGRGSRWFVPVGITVGVLAVGAGLLIVDAVTESPPLASVGYTTSQRTVQVSIDAALAERSAGAISQLGGLPTHLQEFEARSAPEFTTSQRTVQESIDAALVERSAGVVSEGSHARAETNRFEVLRDASAARASVSDGSHARAEANRMATLRDL